jgi:hypothetical protein
VLREPVPGSTALGEALFFLMFPCDGAEMGCGRTMGGSVTDRTSNCVGVSENDSGVRVRGILDVSVVLDLLLLPNGIVGPSSLLCTSTSRPADGVGSGVVPRCAVFSFAVRPLVCTYVADRLWRGFLS